MRVRAASGLRLILVALAILAGAWILSQRPDPSAPPPGGRPAPAAAPFPARISRVLDGDSFRLEGGEEVRLLGIDCPELGEPFHDEARRACRDLCGKREVTIVSCAAGRDPYGRLLALVESDGRLLNEELLLRGLACVYLKDERQPGPAEAQRLIRSQNAAIDGRRGMWSSPRALETRPGEKLLETRFRFHRAGCTALQGASSHRPTTREAALRAGKSPCRTCRPRRSGGGAKPQRRKRILHPSTLRMRMALRRASP